MVPRFGVQKSSDIEAQSSLDGSRDILKYDQLDKINSSKKNQVHCETRVIPNARRKTLSVLNDSIARAFGTHDGSSLGNRSKPVELDIQRR